MYVDKIRILNIILYNIIKHIDRYTNVITNLQLKKNLYDIHITKIKVKRYEYK